MKEYDFEPIRGLPEQLPPGEELLWQGAPRWTTLARRAFHVRKIAVYFLLLAVVLAFGWAEQGGVAAVVQGTLWIALLAALAIGALALLAWGMARTTVYTITSRRLVMRIGVALPMMMNLPFAQIRSVDLRRYADGTGDIPLLLAESARPSYVLFWPHVRPWTFSPPRPMLRAIPDVDRVAGVLADALKAFAETGEDQDGARDDEAESSPAAAS
ncbi:photosynthetic complex putative assembly protein PuhB [Marichromatium bheemlicum]|uniref:PH domain-containing protein n=1 Tax=Marichromatium bheemlicum TaxID=365339 RepID=A0ABX1I5G6_9GAMM|nr:PH domain-containing protein [Marichromatium bheemlicum]